MIGLLQSGTGMGRGRRLPIVSRGLPGPRPPRCAPRPGAGEDAAAPASAPGRVMRARSPRGARARLAAVRRRAPAVLLPRPPPGEAPRWAERGCAALVRGTSRVCEARVSATERDGRSAFGTLVVGGGALEVGNVGTVGVVGTLTVGTGTPTVGGTGTLTVGTVTPAVGRPGTAPAAAIAWPEAYPALNTHAPASNNLGLAPARLTMTRHRELVV